mmetsp:Transcript_85708/g.247516  ORF Transcript_85708/g.247516 Transcript_85708/m.247516 type:complete len:163 (-) Transcript_85708:164-652(-)
MALRSLLALGLVAAAWSADVSPVTDADIHGALASDDTCASTGEEGAMCALQALQLKAEQHAAESTEEEEQDACSSGLVGRVKSYAPGCIAPCPQACGPLGEAMNAYMKHGGQPAAKRVVCAHKSQFSCYLHHWDACQGLVNKAAGFGFHLPRSTGELYGQCR